jgi:hypothetical protein
VGCVYGFSRVSLVAHYVLPAYHPAGAGALLVLLVPLVRCKQSTGPSTTCSEPFCWEQVATLDQDHQQPASLTSTPGLLHPAKARDTPLLQLQGSRGGNR